MKKNKIAFTLVEMIITIIILVILSTIAFLNFWEYGYLAKESAKVSDLKNIEKALQIFYIKNGYYPEPDLENWISVFWETVFEKVWNLSSLPVNSDTKTKYKYTLSTDKKKFFLEENLENEIKNWNKNNNFLEELTYKDSEFCETWDEDKYSFVKIWKNWETIEEWKITKDNSTWLMWETSPIWYSTFEEARQTCQNMTLWWFDDWRLADITEVRSIRNIKCKNPATNKKFFKLKSESYFTSTDIADTWWHTTRYINFSNWIVDWVFHKGISWNFLCVRGTTNLPRQWTLSWYFDSEIHRWNSYLPDLRFSFLENNNEIVKDSKTWLFWEKNSENNNWQDAKNRCETLEKWNLVWRLPTLKELETLGNYHKYNAYDENFFNFGNSVIWTSDKYEENRYWAINSYYFRSYDISFQNYQNLWVCVSSWEKK